MAQPDKDGIEKTNPGSLEDLHKRCQSLFPLPFEGAKFIVNKGLSNNFQVSHTLCLSNGQPNGYRFGATYVGSKLLTLNPTEAFPVLLADMDSSGNVNANIVHAFSTRLRCKFMAQIINSRWQSTQLTTDYRGDMYTASFTLANPNLVAGAGVGVIHFLRSITDRLSLGAELAYQASHQVPGGHVAVTSIAARYDGGQDDYSVAATIGSTGQLHATFVQRCSKFLQVGVEVETNFTAGESSATLGYEMELPKANFTFKGSIDTNLVIRTVLEKKLMPLPFTLALCSILDNRKNRYQLGCGMIIG